MEKKNWFKDWARGKVIFSYKCEDNTFKKTVEEAVKQGVSLSYADLRGEEIIFANLNGVNLSNANLQKSCLSHCDLSNTNLSNANLYSAYLDHSDLSNAILDNVKGLNDQCPKTGSFIGWKKCVGNDDKYYIVKLEISEDAKRSSSTTNKCRCSKAKVLEIQKLNGTKANVDTVHSIYDKNFIYKVGEVVKVPNFNDRYWIECSSGIHFFMDRIAAVIYLS